MDSTHNKKGANTVTLIGIAIVLALVAGLLLSLSNIAKQQRMYAIATYQECADAGYPIMESYPEQCATPDGRTFTNETQSVVLPPVETTEGISANGCAVAGCSAQLCVSADQASEIVSTCEYRDIYACYKEASCEPQADGKCGWTQSAALTQCLANPPALDQTPQAI